VVSKVSDIFTSIFFPLARARFAKILKLVKQRGRGGQNLEVEKSLTSPISPTSVGFMPKSAALKH
jgi:hypothetical protein